MQTFIFVISFFVYLRQIRICLFPSLRTIHSFKGIMNLSVFFVFFFFFFFLALLCYSINKIKNK